eukprot:7869808-Pyramimonas_sp.AAC.1
MHSAALGHWCRPAFGSVCSNRSWMVGPPSQHRRASSAANVGMTTSDTTPVSYTHLTLPTILLV